MKGKAQRIVAETQKEKKLKKKEEIIDRPGPSRDKSIVPSVAKLETTDPKDDAD